MALPAPVVTHPPDWLYERITAVGGPDGARYEASLYGPINGLLSAYFPVTESFMVKPQPKIRPEYMPHPADPFPRSSLDSYHASVIPRAYGGRENPLKEPDFVVVKATQARDNDRIILVIEVKPHGTAPEHGREQLQDYLEGVAAKYRVDTLGPLFHQTLYGLLVIGDTVEMLTFNLQDQVAVVGPMYFRHPVVRMFLGNIFQAN
jgi:hypothetical protein